MTSPSPVIDVFVGPDHGGWRLYFARTSWCPPMLRDHLDENLEAFPVKEPDLADLDRHMWSCDAPYEKSVTKHGGVEIRARGRSAIVLGVWIEGILGATGESGLDREK
jgi:hypothetical protein